VDGSAHSVQSHGSNIFKNQFDKEISFSRQVHLLSSLAKPTFSLTLNEIKL